MSAARVDHFSYLCNGCGREGTCPWPMLELHSIWLGYDYCDKDPFHLCDSCANKCKSVHLHISPEQRYNEDKEYFFKVNKCYFPIEILPLKRKDLSKDIRQIIKHFDECDVVHSSKVPLKQLNNEFRRVNYIQDQ